MSLNCVLFSYTLNVLNSISWYSFTEEWAWHRAEQDVRKELGVKQRKYMKQEEIETLIEKRYESGFETYVKEVALEEQEKTGRTKGRMQTPKK